MRARSTRVDHVLPLRRAMSTSTCMMDARPRPARWGADADVDLCTNHSGLEHKRTDTKARWRCPTNAPHHYWLHRAMSTVHARHKIAALGVALLITVCVLSLAQVSQLKRSVLGTSELEADASSAVELGASGASESPMQEVDQPSDCTTPQVAQDLRLSLQADVERAVRSAVTNQLLLAVAKLAATEVASTVREETALMLRGSVPQHPPAASATEAGDGVPPVPAALAPPPASQPGLPGMFGPSGPPNPSAMPVQAIEKEVDDHACALPTSALESTPFVPDDDVEQPPARLTCAPNDEPCDWPNIMPTQKCAALGGTEILLGTGRQARFKALPAAGISTRSLPATTATVTLRCKKAPAMVFKMGVMNAMPQARPDQPEPSLQRPHILMFGHDSISRNAFLRHFPLMQQYMTDPANFPHHELFDYEYYHSVQYNTNGNLHVLYGNITHVNERYQGRRIGYDLDNDGKLETFLADTDQKAFNLHKDWIWLRSRERGYSSWWFDAPTRPKVPGQAPSGAFYTNNQRYPTSDVELVHPHWLDQSAENAKRARCSCLKDANPCVPTDCTYNRYRGDIMHERLLDAWRRHSHKAPVFLGGFDGFAHHVNQARSLRVLDAYDVRLFKELFSTPQAANAFVMLFSDHGVNYGIQDSNDGIMANMETKRPMLFVWAPRSWLAAHPEARAGLLANRKTLMTHADMYRTFLEIMDGPGSWEGRRFPWQQSFFQPVSRERTCEDAHIAPAYCACVKWRESELTAQQQEALEAALVRDLPPVCVRPVKVAAVQMCRTAELKRTDERYSSKKKRDGSIATRVVVQLSEKGTRVRSPTVMATLLEAPDGRIDVAEVRQMGEYGPYIGCLPPEEHTLYGDRCICPATGQ